MNKVLVALAVICSLMLLVVGCKASPSNLSNPSEPSPEAAEGTNPLTQPEASGTPTSTAPPEEVSDSTESEVQDAAETEVPTGEKELPVAGAQDTDLPDVTEITETSASGITGSISEIDMLDSDLSDPEIDKTGEYLEEISW